MKRLLFSTSCFGVITDSAGENKKYVGTKKKKNKKRYMVTCYLVIPFIRSKQ